MFVKSIFSNDRYETDNNFRLICETRIRIRQALNTKSKSSSTLDILGIDIDTYRKWLEYQFIPEMNWINIEIDNVRPFSSFDKCKDEKLKDAFNWKITQPLLKHDH